MLGAISAGANLVTGIAKGIIGNAAHKKYAKSLNGLKMTMPGAITEADSIYGSMAGTGLAGKDIIGSNLEADQAASLSSMKKAATSPTALLDAVVKTGTNLSRNKLNLDVKDAQTKDANSQIYANFLGTVKSPAQQRIEQFEIDKKIAIAKEKMAGTKELMGGIEGGIGAGLGSFGKGMEIDQKSASNSGFWNSLT